VTALSRECRAKIGALVVIHPKNEQSATKQFNVSQKFAAA
jgi:ribosomal protein S17